DLRPADPHRAGTQHDLAGWEVRRLGALPDLHPLGTLPDDRFHAVHDVTHVVLSAPELLYCRGWPRRCSARRSSTGSAWRCCGRWAHPTISRRWWPAACTARTWPGTTRTAWSGCPCT